MNSVVSDIFPYLLVYFLAVNCTPYDPPINGLIACSYSDFWNGDACAPQCNAKKQFARTPALYYVCRSTGEWYVWASNKTVSLEMPWPDCTGRPTNLFIYLFSIRVHLLKFPFSFCMNKYEVKFFL